VSWVMMPGLEVSWNANRPRPRLEVVRWVRPAQRRHDAAGRLLSGRPFRERRADRRKKYWFQVAAVGSGQPAARGANPASAGGVGTRRSTCRGGPNPPRPHRRAR